MSTIRQDAWNDEEDLLLAETVLRHIREGSTQLKAFQEVGKKLSRTAAACGFRWNSLVRKQYESAIILAKQQRKELNKKNKGDKKPTKLTSITEQVESPLDSKANPTNIDLTSVISYLEGIKETEERIKKLQKENADLKNKIKELEWQESRLEKDYTALKQEYSSILSMMDKARKFAEKA